MEGWSSEWKGHVREISRQYGKLMERKDPHSMMMLERDVSAQLAVGKMTESADSLLELSNKIKVVIVTHHGLKTSEHLQAKTDEAIAYSDRIQQVTHDLAGQVEDAIRELLQLQQQSRFQYLLDETTSM